MTEDQELELVERLAEEFIERFRRGEKPSIKDYAERYPEQAEIIRDTFQALAMMEDLAPASDDSFGDASPSGKPAVGAARLDQLGDYRIVREVGRGGMGIVYEAEQVSLGRHVAVKVLPKDLLQNAKQRSRFQREAKAAAKLHHTNIVPVFGVGEENGLGYYVMQFIQGLALDEVLDELKRMKPGPGMTGVAGEPGRLRARRRDVSAADVARSLLDGEFRSLAADEQRASDEERRIDETLAHYPDGVAKPPSAVGHTAPSNSASGDGLGSPSSFLESTATARLSDTSLSSSSVVLPGSSSGTEKRNRKSTYWQSVAHIGAQVAEALHYAHGQGVLHRDIKPSNLLLDLHGTVWVTDFGLAKLDDDRGLTQTGDVLGTLRYMAPETLKQQTDARSEVYSLGLTLYELLALRPALEPTNRHALIDQVLVGQIEPLPKRNPEIPRDLATIVHKAIERDPRHRYQTAQDLADDLRRFIDDEPIQARRLSTLEHVVRWSRHNRGLAASLAAVATLVSVLAILSTLAAGYFRSVNSKLSNTVVSLEATQGELHDKVEALNAAKGEAQKRAAENLQLANVAQENLRKTMAAEAEAQQAEKRSREFRYSTDVQLAGMLVADETANAARILARLADHDPAENKELADKEDLRGFEWHYLNRLVEGRANVIKGFDNEVVDAALSPRGELVTLDRDARLQSWDTITRRQTRPALDLKKGRGVTAQALSRDGHRAALAIGNQVYLVDATTGEENARSIPAQSRCGLIFSPDGRMLIAVDTDVGWWDAATGKPIARQEFQLTAQGEGSQPLSVSADGLTVAVGGQGNHRSQFSVFEMNSEMREITLLLDKAGDVGTKRALAISPDGGTVAVSLCFQGAIHLYDAASGKRSTFHDSAHTASISAISFSPDGTQLVTAATDGSVKVWEDYKRLKAAKTTALVGHAKQVNAVAFLARGKQIWSAGSDRTVRLWNVEQNAASLHRTVAGAFGHRGWFSPDGMLMALSNYTGSSYNKRLQLRDAATGQVVAQLRVRSDELGSDSVAFSPDNRLLAAGFGGKKDISYIELWDIDRRERLAVLPGSTDIPGFTTSETSGMVPALAFSPDGNQLVAGFGSLRLLGSGDQGNHPLLVYDVAARRVIRQLEGHRNDCVSVTFSRDGSRMASASYDGTARIWDTGAWKELHVLDNPDAASDRGRRRVCDVAFSPDGKLLAMASAEGDVIVWDTAAGGQLQTLSGHANEVWSVGFSPNGRTLASGSMDGTIRLWNTATWRELVRLDPRASFDPRSLTFSPDGDRLLAASYRGEAMVWSVLPAGEEAGPAPEQLAAWLAPGIEFQNRVRLQSETQRLQEALEKFSQERPDNEAVQTALAAIRANWHASRHEWQPAVEQFDRLRQLSPKPPDAWLRSPGLLRLATALFHQDRPAEAATLLKGGEKRRSDDGNGARSVSFGFGYAMDAYPFKLIQVFRGSPAWQAGLRAGDLLLKFNEVETTAENLTRLQELLSGGETTVRFTVQHAGVGPTLRGGEGRETLETVELAKASHIQDDVTSLLIEDLLAAVNQKLAKSPDDPGLLELRAELAGQSSDHQRQVADYTAAIEALSAPGGDKPVAEFVRIPAAGLQQTPLQQLQRLYCRRGNAYLGLKQWQQAADDYAKGITDETTDDDLLANQALAQAKVMTPEAFVQLGREDQSHGIHLIDYRDDGATQPATINGRDCRLIGPAGNGSKYAYFAIDTEFKWSESMRAEVEIEYFDDASGAFRVQYDAHEGAYREADKPVQRSGSAEWRTARFALANARFANSQNGGADFRIENLFGIPLYFKRVAVRRLFPGAESDNPWVRLAAAYRIESNDQAIDGLVERRPQAAGAIGDLFAADNQWQRAIDIYSQGLSWGGPHEPEAQARSSDELTSLAHRVRVGLRRPPHRLDADLLSRRARAYEDLHDWNAAAADWQRAASQGPEAAKLLADFANRLLQVAPALRDGDLARAERRRLAATVRQRAQRLLEAALEADPGDNPAIAALAGLLLDISDPDQLMWTALKPAELKTERGAALALEDDGSLRVQYGTDAVALPDAGHSLAAIRVETSPDAAAAESTAFAEYQILSTRLPAEGFFGQYVRIDLPGDDKQFPRRKEDGDKKILSLAEVQILQGDQNLARSGHATQSTTLSVYGGGDPQRALDGDTSADWSTGSITHTEEGEDLHPWWEVDLGEEHGFDRIAIWNRSADYGQRLSHFRVRVLDASRTVVFEQLIAEAPDPSREINRRVKLAKVEPEAADGGGQWQLRLDTAGGRHPWKRFRISVTDDQPALAAGEVEAGDVKWSLAQPTDVTPTPALALAAQADGSFLVGPAASDSIVLGKMPESAKLVRVESAAEAGEPDQAKSPAFNEYRAQALGAAVSESGALRGRYVRIDLPGDNKRFPRGLNDGEKKMINLAELQVFQGERNMARGKKARQSSADGDAVAQRAVDGNTDSSDAANSSARTGAGHDVNNPWWEVDLESEQPIDRMVVWNRVAAPRRMNHFRVRILDGSRNVVFEQVIDQAPKPSREIVCRSFVVEKPPATDGDRPRWSLLFGEHAGLGPWERFRIFAADNGWSPEQEETHAQARSAALPNVRLAAAYAVAGEATKAAQWLGESLENAASNEAKASLVETLQGFPDALAAALELRPDDARLQLALARAIGKAHAQRGQAEEAVAAFARALDRVEEDGERKNLMEQIQEHPAALAVLARQRPEELPLQLALARTLAESGKKALAEGRQEEALAQLAEAQEVYARLLAEHPEPKWTVLRPTALESEGGAELTLREDGSILAGGNNPDQDSYTLTLGDLPAAVTAIRLETLSDPTLPNGGPGRAPNGTFVLTRISAVDGQRTPPPWVAALADYSQPGLDVSRALLPRRSPQSNVSGWAIGGAPMKTPVALFAFQQPWKRQAGSAPAVRLDFEYELANRTLGRFRLSATEDDNVLEVVRFHQELKASGLADLAISLAGAHGRQGRIDEAAAAFAQALDLATDREGRAKVLNEASEYEGVLAKLDECRPAVAAFQDALARHCADHGEWPRTREAAARARALYEQKLESEPRNSQLAKELADLLLDVRPVEWTVLTPVEMKSKGGATLLKLADGSVLAGGKNPLGDAYTIFAQANVAQVGAIRLEALTHETLPNQGPGRDEQHNRGTFDMVQFTITAHVAGTEPRLVEISRVAADYHLFDLSANHWNVTGGAAAPHTVVYQVKQPVDWKDDARLELLMQFSASTEWPLQNLGRFRLSVSGDAGAFAREESRLAALKVADPWPRLGAAYASIGDENRSLGAFSQALALAPDDAARVEVARQAAPFETVFAALLERASESAHLRLGQAKYLAPKRIADNQVLEALHVISQALETFPDDLDLLAWRAEARMKLRQWSAAIGDYSRVIDRQTDQPRRREAERARAEVQLRRGQFHEGAEGFLQEMFLSPNDFWRVREAAAAQLLAGNPATAGAAADRLWRKAPAELWSDPAIWLVRILVAQPGLITTENRPKLLDAAKKVGPALTGPMTAAVHYRLGDLTHAEVLVAQSGGDRQLQALAAMLLYDQGKVDEARQVLNGVTNWLENERAKDPKSAVPAQQEWRFWAVTTAVWREAARKLIGPRLAELDGLVNKVKLEIVKAEYGAGAAQKDVAEALRKRLADVRMITLPSRSYISVPTSSYNAAFGDPAPSKVKQLKVQYRLNDRVGEATFGENNLVVLPVPDALLKDGPEDAKALLERARLLADAGLDEEALDDLDRLVALKVDSPEMQALRGRVLAGLNRADEALSHLNRAVEAGSNDARVFGGRAEIHAKLGEWNAAKADWRRALELSLDDDAETALLHTRCLEFGKLCAATGDWRGAAVAFRSALALKPDDCLIWLRAAPLLVLAGDEAAYREFCREMARQFRGADDAAVAERVCKACLLLPGAVDLSEFPVKRLQELATEPLPATFRPWFLACYALVSYREGNAQDAIRLAEQVDVPNKQPVALALVVRAMAEHQLGQTEKARQTLAEASALIPTKLRTLGADAHGPLPVAEAMISHDWLIPEILRREASALIDAPSGG